MSDSGLVVLGHGSRDAAGVAEFLAVAGAVRAALPGSIVEAGVLEFAGPGAPSIPDAFARCVARGARRIVAAPALLHFGGHATDDMPAQVAAARARHPQVEIRLAQPLSGHPALLEIVAERCAASGLSATADTTVLLVGRGSTSARANADLYATARQFAERGEYPAVEVCFVSLTPPCVPAGLRRCVALGARRVIVAPYFLNTGLLVRRIGTQIAAARGFYPHVETAVVGHFGPDRRVIGALLDRARAAWPEVVRPGGRPDAATPPGHARPARPLAPAGGRP